VQTVAETHPPNDCRAHTFGIRHRFVGRDIVGQILLVDAAEGAQEGPQTSPRTFTTIAMDFAYSIPIVIARPFLHAVADVRMLRMHAPIVRRLIRIQDGALRWHVAFNNGTGGRLVGVLKHPGRAARGCSG
jgi:hypothetical protein